MFPHNTKNLVYFSTKNKENAKSEKSVSEDEFRKILQTLAKQSMKEKTPEFSELEAILQNSIKDSENEDESSESKEFEESGGSSSLVKLLMEKGYLKDKQKWLTNKGFFEIGKQILRDVMSDLNSSEIGLHETKNHGEGNVTIDNTKKIELGDELKNLSVVDTLLNSIKRISKNKQIEIPLQIEPEDFEQFETLEDVRVSIVYCIDLSSTMKYTLGTNGISRIEAAKKALWSLYVLNKKFFPNDSIHIVGFASMASEVNPYDIPYLKTFDANDNFLHYTNYQAALQLARKILRKDSAQNKRIVMITDGQPSACFVENEQQKNAILAEKPYSNFYVPEENIISKIKKEKNLKLNSDPSKLVYLCYRYKKVDPKINDRSIFEAKKCKKEGIEIDSIVISDEIELLDYVKELERELKGKVYHIEKDNVDKILVSDFLKTSRKILKSQKGW